MEKNTISIAPPPHSSMDFPLLRAEGLRHIQRLAGHLWTDHNTHDPGITILEQLCYAITDLGYRMDHPIDDLLYTPEGTDPYQDLFEPEQLLPSRPINQDDYRKLLLDIPEVKNATLLPILPEEEKEGDDDVVVGGTAADPLILGHYKVVIEPEVDASIARGTAAWQTKIDAIIDQVWHRLLSHRNLCEDFVKEEVKVSAPETIIIEAKIEIEDGVAAEQLLAEVYFQLATFISPRLKFYSLSEMLEKGYAIEDILDGPILEHGFIDPKELQQFQKRTQLRTSDMVQLLMDIPGVTTVISLNLLSLDPAATSVTLGAVTAPGTFVPKTGEWGIELETEKFPELRLAYLERSAVDENLMHYAVFSQENAEPANLPPSAPPKLSIRLCRKPTETRFDPALDEALAIDSIPEIAVNSLNVWNAYNQLQKEARVQAIQPVVKQDFAKKSGRYRDVENYYSFQHHLPLVYGVGAAGLPQSASQQRKTQAKQLKAYLLFFDQLLANYFTQLAHFSQLFSFQKAQIPTYYAQDPLSVAAIEQVWSPAISDHTDDDLSRRNRFLNHLLARFGETFTDYSLLLFGQTIDPDDQVSPAEKLAKAKQSFLLDYPAISSSRASAFNYTLFSVPNVTIIPASGSRTTNNLSGLERRLYRLFGWYTQLEKEQLVRTEMTSNTDPEVFYIVEHLLLEKPLNLSLQVDAKEFKAFILSNIPDDITDPISLQLTFVLPGFGPTFSDRDLIKRMIRQETPAHLGVFIKYIDDIATWNAFENAYYEWHSELIRISNV